MTATLFDMSDPQPPRQVISVAELNRQLREALQERFPSVWVVGEITDLARPQSGHVYLTLKDAQGQLRAVIWRSVASRLGFELQDGMEVIVEGAIDVYPPRGTYQLIVRQVEPRGRGSLQVALEQLRERLGAEGIFARERKRPLPRFPHRVVVITSPTGAAIRDFLEVQRRRWQDGHVLVIPTRVQGAEAVPDILSALRLAHLLAPKPDVIVLTRGGGSLEDLWCFNDEQVVRAVAASAIPVVSAIGHEIDVTLCDLAADVRALTPSEAAELVSPSAEQLRGELKRLERLLANQLLRRLQTARTRLEAIERRPVLARPLERIRDLSRQLDDWENRLQRGLSLRLERAKRQTDVNAGRLHALSPLAVLERGYSLTRQLADGTPVRSVHQLAVGQQILTLVADGSLVSRVESCEAGNSREKR